MLEVGGFECYTFVNTIERHIFAKTLQAILFTFGASHASQTRRATGLDRKQMTPFSMRSAEASRQSSHDRVERGGAIDEDLLWKTYRLWKEITG